MTVHSSPDQRDVNDQLVVKDDGTIRLDTSEGNGVFIPDGQKFYWGDDLDVSHRWDDTNTVFIIADEGTREFARFDPGSEVAFNEDGAAVDLRAESEDSTNMLTVHGASSPSGSQVSIHTDVNNDWGALFVGNRDASTAAEIDVVATLGETGGGAAATIDPNNSEVWSVSLRPPQIDADSATTVTDAAPLYIDGPIAAGTNVTITNQYLAKLEDDADNDVFTVLNGGTVEAGQGPLNLSGGDLQRNGTAVVGTQESAIASLTNNQTDTTTDGTLESIGDTSSGDQSAPIERNISEVNSKVDAILTALQNHGLIAT